MILLFPLYQRCLHVRRFRDNEKWVSLDNCNSELILLTQ